MLIRGSLLALLAAATLTIAATAAEASVSSPASTYAASHQAIPATPALMLRASNTAYAKAMRVTLNGSQCAALRDGLNDRTASCTIAESLHLSAFRPITVSLVRDAEGHNVAADDTTAEGYVAAADTTAEGYMQACAVVLSGIDCDPNQWWVTDYFAVVSNGTKIWNTNGPPECASNHTAWTWCSYVGNGTAEIQEGFNFGSSGWARIDISADGDWGTRGPAWANIYAYLDDVVDV